MARPAPQESIGDRIRTRRELREWSIRHAASRAGLHHSMWARIENGEVGADNRYTLAKIATALECAVTDLTDFETPPADAAGRAALIAVPAIRTALVDVAMDEPGIRIDRPAELVMADAELVTALRLRDDYAGMGRLLPDVLRELHSLAKAANRDALRALVEACHDAMVMLKNTSSTTEALYAADRCHDAARALRDPVMLGLAAWSRGQAALRCGSYGRALHIADAAIPALSRAARRPGAMEVMGQLHLNAAMALAIDDADESAARVAEAGAIAARTGETETFGFAFGPTNIRLWQVAIEADAGDPERAVAIANGTNPSVLPAARQSVFWTDTGRAVARLGRDDQAVKFLLRAEQVSPQRFHASPVARETTRDLVHRASGPNLRGLAQRVGLITP